MSLNIIFHVITNILGIGIYCYNLKKRKMFWLRLPVALAVYLVYSFVFSRMLWRLGYMIWITYLNYLLNIGILYLGVFACFEIKPIIALFCTTCGYCIQHITQRVHNLIFYVLLQLPRESAFDGLAHAAVVIIALAVCFAIQRKYFRRLDENREINNLWQIILTSSAFLASVFLEEWIFRYLFSGPENLLIGCYVVFILFALLVLFLEYHLVLIKNAKDENDFLKQVMEAERRQYETEKNVIDIISIKVHDLKHRLSLRPPVADPAEAEDTNRAISQYDCFYKTGNNILDTVLTTKGLVCENKKIKFSCVVDGERFSFMSDEDIYSLFGNLIDNCIEATETLPPDKRAIVLQATTKDKFLFVSTENYYSGVKVFTDGLPQTTKPEKMFHGFGMRSIRNIAQKYGGDLRIDADNGVFRVNLMFCLS